MPLEPGLLDREIVIQTATKSQDSVTNQEVLTWDSANDLPLWAQWIPGGTREAWQAQRVESEIDGLYKIYDLDPRPLPDVNRIIGHDGRLYDLRPVIEVGRGEGLLLPVVARGEAP